MSTSTERTSTERNQHRTPSSRRRFLQQVAISGVALGPGSAFLASCATGGGDSDDEAAQEGEVSEDNPLGIPTDQPLEIFIFNGGFGDAYATELHEPMFSDKWPDATIEHNAVVDIAGELQARFVAGDPPDFVNDSGEGQIPLGQLVTDKQLYDLSDLFDAPSWDDPDVKVRDTLIPGTIESGTFGDAPYVLNYAFTIYGNWYNKTLFDQNGWTVPATWDDMLALCAEIKATGMAPWVYTGVHARYMNWPLLTMAATLGGPEVLVAIDNLEPGAWGQDAVKEAAAALAGLRTSGYYLEGCEGMDHRQAQVAWAQGKAAFVSCGTWLENEEADAIPDTGFEIAMMPCPVLSSDAKLPAETVRATAGEPYIVPAEAKNPRGALEYMRVMLSQEGARGFTEQVSSLAAVKGSADGVQLPPGLTSAQSALSTAGDNVINWFYSTWYREMENPGIDEATASLLAGRSSVDDWVATCEAEATKVRDDDAITKYTR